MVEISVPKEEKKIQMKFGTGIQQILVDSREPQIFYESLRKDRGLMCKVVTLEAGDYAFSNVGIERKEFNDYMNSLTSGRLWKQMRKMKLAYERPILAIEGLKDPSIQLQGLTTTRFLSSVAHIILMGINVVFLPTRTHFLYFVQYMFLSSDKKVPSLRPLEKKKYGWRGKMDIKEDMLTMVPGIGRKTAKAILARFNTMDELMRLSVLELVQQTPLGTKKAKILWEILHS